MEDDDFFLESEFSEPYKAWKADPTPQAASGLLKAVNPVLTAAMRSYGTQGSPTLRSRAKILALDAIAKYDPSRSALRTHLMSQLQGLRRFSAKETQAISIPEQVSLDLGKLREGENFLRDKYGRDPSDTELADYAGLSIKRISYIRKAKPTYAESSLQSGFEEDDDVYSPAVASRPGKGIYQWHNLVYNDLDPRDQIIMEHTFGMHGKPVLSNQEIARRIGISPGAISQRRAKIQAKLDLREDLGVL